MEMSRHVLSFCVSDVELLCGQIDHTLSLKQGWRGGGEGLSVKVQIIIF